MGWFLLIMVNWLFAFLGIVGIAKHDNAAGIGQYPGGELTLVVYFGAIWIAIFMQHQIAFTTMVAASTYYFSSSKQANGQANVSLAIKWCWTKHFGSLAYGSLIIAIISTIYKEKKEGERRFSIMDCVFCCIKELLESLNKRAYSYMAVTGQSYCKSCYGGLMMYFKHFIEFSMSIVISAMVINTGKFMILLINGLIGLGIGAAWVSLASTGWIGFGAGVALGAVSANICLGQFDEAINATLQSMAFDEEVNGDICFGPVTFHEKLEEMERDLQAEEAAKGGNEGQVAPAEPA
jgi:hypothetical protein